MIISKVAFKLFQLIKIRFVLWQTCYLTGDIVFFGLMYKYVPKNRSSMYVKYDLFDSKKDFYLYIIDKCPQFPVGNLDLYLILRDLPAEKSWQEKVRKIIDNTVESAKDDDFQKSALLFPIIVSLENLLNKTKRK